MLSGYRKIMFSDYQDEILIFTFHINNFIFFSFSRVLICLTENTTSTFFNLYVELAKVHVAFHHRFNNHVFLFKH